MPRIVRVEIICEPAPVPADRVNEDDAMFWEHPRVPGLAFAAAIDGVSTTVRSDYDWEPTAGRYASRFVKQALLSLFLEEPEIRLRQAFIRANELLYHAIDGKDPGWIARQCLSLSDPREIRHYIPACVATAVRIGYRDGRYGVEYVHAGDTCLIAGLKDGSLLVPTSDQMGRFDAEALRLALRLQHEAAGAIPTLRQAVELPEVQWANQRNRMRHNYVDEGGATRQGEGCGVLDGLPEIAAYLQDGFIPADQVAFLLLVSDGLLWPAPAEDIVSEVPVPAADSANQVNDLHRKTATLATADGLQALLGAVRRLEREDPGFDRYPRMKAHDDATGVLIGLS